MSTHEIKGRLTMCGKLRFLELMEMNFAVVKVENLAAGPAMRFVFRIRVIVYFGVDRVTC